MTKASDNEFPSLLVKEGIAPASPAAGDQRLFIDSADHLLKVKNSSGTVTGVGGGGSGSITASGYTQSTARLLGRTTASAGAIEEITVGSGLSLSAGALTATGGGSGQTPPTQFQYNVVNAASCAITFGATPASNCVLLCQVGLIGNFTVSSITQTNVSWTLLHAKSNGTSSRVEVWVGIPSGTPGTLVTLAPSGSANVGMTVSEWPSTAGLAGTLDQSADDSGSSGYQNTGIVVPTTAGALALATFVNANGTIPLGGMTGPFHPLISPTTFMMFGYYWSGKNPIQSMIPVQSSSTWANTLISVV